jgi:hypothetical protein
MLTTSPETNEIAAALAKAQAQMGSAELDGVNPHLRSRYATLNSVIKAIQGPLSSSGISFIQGTDTDFESKSVTVYTRLSHSSGQWYETSLSLTPKSFSAQHVGSEITYAKRYTLSSLCGIAAGDEDDGEASAPTSGRDNFENAKRQASQQAAKKNNSTKPPETDNQFAQALYKQDKEKYLSLCREYGLEFGKKEIPDWHNIADEKRSAFIAAVKAVVKA